MLSSFFSKPDPDADLVAAARAGDARAFDALVGRHQGPLQRFLRARLGPDLDADDVAQETFVAAWRQLPAFHGRGRFKTWLFGIALNLCANTIRRERQQRERCAPLEEELAASAAGSSPASLSEVSALVERVELRQRLSELPDPGREVLELYYYADLNLREVSQLLGVNLSTLKYWFYQAHERLRAALASPGEVEAQNQRAGVRR